MPEGPSILILKETLQPFKGKKVLAATGNTKVDISRLTGQKIIDFKTWGKHFLICFKKFTVRIHLMMFGSYRVNERKDTEPRLRLTFADGEINFYTCSVKILEEDPDEVYDWAADVLSDSWTAAAVKKKLKKHPERLVCDVLLDQDIFAGVGNIIKNEVLFRIHAHPLSTVGALPPKKLTELVNEARNYSFDFLKWKRVYELKKHWLVYNKKICPRDHIPVKKEHLGLTNRRTFYCPECQVLYT
ncbi:MAG: DNA-formamidopyrimidine glycosylase family protein [Flavipsychrobacter sp.]